jgi:hypothetical protein
MNRFVPNLACLFHEIRNKCRNIELRNIFSDSSPGDSSFYSSGAKRDRKVASKANLFVPARETAGTKTTNLKIDQSSSVGEDVGFIIILIFCDIHLYISYDHTCGKFSRSKINNKGKNLSNFPAVTLWALCWFHVWSFFLAFRRETSCVAMEVYRLTYLKRKLREKAWLFKYTRQTCLTPERGSVH